MWRGRGSRELVQKLNVLSFSFIGRGRWRRGGRGRWMKRQLSSTIHHLQQTTLVIIIISRLCFCLIISSRTELINAPSKTPSEDWYRHSWYIIAVAVTRTCYSSSDVVSNLHCGRGVGGRGRNVFFIFVLIHAAHQSVLVTRSFCIYFFVQWNISQRSCQDQTAVYYLSSCCFVTTKYKLLLQKVLLSSWMISMSNLSHKYLNNELIKLYNSHNKTAASFNKISSL